MTVISEFDFIIHIMMDCIEMLYNHNIACRHSILDAIGKLTKEDFIQNFDASVGSIRDILVHLVNTEDYWISVLKDGDHKELFAEDYNDVSAIIKVWRKVEPSTKEYLEKQNERTLQVGQNVILDNMTIHFTIAKALIHLAIHETHHRGHIVGLIRQLEYESPNVNML